MSKIWLELALASLAAMYYLFLSRSKQPKTTSNPGQDNASPFAVKESYVAPVQYQSDKELTASQLILKAMAQGRFEEGIAMMQRSPLAIRRVPTDLACNLLIAATKFPRAGMADQLRALTGKISSPALDLAIGETMKAQDFESCRRLHMISGILSIQKSQRAFLALAKAHASDPSALRVLVEEAGTPLPINFAQAVLESCTHGDVKDSSLTAAIYQKVSPVDAAILRDEVLEGPSVGIESSSALDDLCHVNYHNPQSCKEISMRANDIRSCGKNGDLQGAIKIFDRLGSLANSTLILNSVLDACVECKDVEKAVKYFNQPELNGLADVITFNTMMKGYISIGQEGQAKQLLAQLSRKGLSATRTSFHGLLNARVNAKDFPAAWKLVAEMQAAGISPNAVTCSILLKGKMSTHSDVIRVLSLIDAMDQPMDDVLFLSVVEACIRTGRLDLLTKQAEKFMNQDGASSLSAPTYGSMIKAYGHARDLKRVWHFWDQMLFHGVSPTSITLGCMVEALVGNGCALEAWTLAAKLRESDSTKDLVNTVIYSSILKGFAHLRDCEKVMALYEEMKSHGVQANTITFNTILNAFAQGGAMHRVPPLLEDMKTSTPQVEPDLVTYSTIVKGFCNAGQLDRALSILNDMKTSGKIVPDEVMYNSLLGGCAKEHRPDDALQLLDDMRKFNVAPSNYTLSMLVKLMGRCRRINQAFTMLEDISKEFDLKINIQVYTCLIQGCFNAGQPGKAMALLEKIMEEGVAPDSMTYTVLVRGCVQGGLLEKAVELVRLAYGRGPTPGKGTPPGLNAGCFDELVHALGGPTSDTAKDIVSELGDCPPACSGKGNGKGGSKGSGKDGSAYGGMGKGSGKTTGRSPW